MKYNAVFKRCRIGIALAGITFTSVFSLYSQNLVFNGTFAAGGGSFADWVISHVGGPPYSGPTIVSSGVNGDPYAARSEFEYYGEDDQISQNISTTPGVVYDVNFWANDGQGQNFIGVKFGNFTTNLTDFFNIGPGEWIVGWTNIDFKVTATSSESDLEFDIAADTTSDFFLDDISVSPVTPMMQAAPVGKTFQITVTNPPASTVIQASTNLFDWTDVYTNTPPFTFTDTFAAFPYRFYRAAVFSE